MTWRLDLALYFSARPDLWIMIHHWSKTLVFQNSMFYFDLKINVEFTNLAFYYRWLLILCTYFV